MGGPDASRNCKLQSQMKPKALWAARMQAATASCNCKRSRKPFGQPRCKPQLQAAIANETLHCIALRLDCIALRLHCIAAGLHCIALHCIALHCGWTALRMLCIALLVLIGDRGRVGETFNWESLLGRVNRIVFCLTRLAFIGYCVLRVL